MKSRYLSAAALVVTLGVAVSVPAGASATPGPSRLTIAAQPNPITAGDPVVVYGRLVGQRDQNRLVVLYASPALGSGTFVPVQSTRTDSTAPTSSRAPMGMSIRTARGMCNLPDCRAAPSMSGSRRW